VRAQNRHDKEKWKKKKHPASKCGDAKCLICHSAKVLKMPNRKLLRENSKKTEQ